VLDLALPDGDGIELVRSMRAWSSSPILVLSARGEEKDKIQALDAGADDYLTKPFGIGELMARVRALARRRGRNDTGEPVFRVGDIEVDFSTRRVKRDGQLVHLTPLEYRLLTLLATNAGRVMTHRQILREVWGPAHVEHEHYARIYMGHLRRKLEADPTQPRFLLTETAVGYRLVAG
jgi:two-component system, OmpR family, KDP operon response regulator KdpE